MSKQIINPSFMWSDIIFEYTRTITIIDIDIIPSINFNVDFIINIPPIKYVYALCFCNIN